MGPADTGVSLLPGISVSPAQYHTTSALHTLITGAA